MMVCILVLYVFLFTVFCSDCDCISVFGCLRPMVLLVLVCGLFDLCDMIVVCLLMLFLNVVVVAIIRCPFCWMSPCSERRPEWLLLMCDIDPKLI